MPRDRVVIIPIASIEYHGALPLETDYIIAKCILNNLKESLSIKGENNIITLPPIAYSASIEHIKAGPTASIKPSTFSNYIYELTTTIYNSNLSNKIIYPIIHGGAYHTAYIAARQAMQETGGRIIVAIDSLWKTLQKYLYEKYGLRTTVIHADPIEASLLVACDTKARGVEETDPDTVLLEEARIQQEYRELLEPWMSWNIRYPETPVPASKILGKELLEEYTKHLEEKIEKIKQIIL